MPPTATTMRKTSTTMTTMMPQTADTNAPQRRTTSGRPVRPNTTRPTNYYVKPYASFSAAGAAANNEAEMADATPPGFFPALTYFTDAITALPREVMRQFTLMKEVEAKIHGPNERLGELVDGVMEYPVPPRKPQDGNGSVGVGGQGLVSLTANNSVVGSTSVSLVNGVAPNMPLGSTMDSVAGSVNGEEGGEEELTKRQQFNELRQLTQNLLINLEEKNVVLAEANRILEQQHRRIDSVMPHIDAEISEEARLGSMTHWAYSDNRQKRQPAGAAANRRDVAATNSLALAASAIHESDIAQARRDAVREGAREKHKGRKEQVDSDFDDKPKKTHAKVAKSKATGQAAGLGISANGEPVKKRKVDKNLAAPAMDRTASTKGVKASKETPRSTPNAEAAGKKAKVKPAPLPTKRKGMTSASPALASSPLHSSFQNADAARPQSARLRQNSTATNLRHEKLANEERPTSAPVKVNGEKDGRKRKVPADEADSNEEMIRSLERADSLKREDADPSTDRPHLPRSGSNSGKAGRGSATGTPRQESFGDGAPAMVRARSTRSLRATRDESSSEPQAHGSRPAKHKRNISNSHLVRQLAPFNRSPDIDRHRDDMDEDLDSFDLQREKEFRAEGAGSPPKRQQRSRRNTATAMATSPPASDVGDEDATMLDARDPADYADAEDEADTAAERTATPALSPDPAGTGSEIPLNHPDYPQSASPTPSEPENEEYDEDEEGGDPDDPNEPKYCYCDRGSYGEMIACDNEQCPREWFHLGCTGLKEPPEEEEKWFCRDCAPLFSHVRAPNRRGRGRGRK